jgi:hypothetical protein
MSSLALILVFIAGAAVSLTSSWVLVSRLERVGARLGFSEALLGLAAILASGIALHRRVIALEGVVAVGVSVVCLLVVVGTVPAPVGLGATAAILGAYLLLLSAGPARLGRWASTRGGRCG